MNEPIETKARLLLVDDQPLNNTIIGEALKEDYVLTAATSGEEALRCVEADPPDMVLLDVLMPEMDGFEVCQKLKQNPSTADIPVIFVTSMDDTINEEYGLKVGAVDYITKPINPAIVRARVRLHIRLEQYREFLEKLLELRTDELNAAQAGARNLLER